MMNTLDAGIVTFGDEGQAIKYINEKCGVWFTRSGIEKRCVICFYSMQCSSPEKHTLYDFIETFKSAPFDYPENVVMSLQDDNSGIEEIIRPNGY